MNKIVPAKDANGVVIPGKYEAVAATAMDFVNPLVPLEGDGPNLARTLAYIAIQAIVVR